MREIKFRGYCKDELIGSQWVTDGYGVFNIDYVNGARDTFLTTPYGDYNVYEESVGQYTGLKDKNGKDIFEGDILKDNCGEIDLVVYEEYMFNLRNFYDSGYDIPSDAFSEGTNRFEVIGNIYENPELLKE